TFIYDHGSREKDRRRETEGNAFETRVHRLRTDRIHFQPGAVLRRMRDRQIGGSPWAPSSSGAPAYNRRRGAADTLMKPHHVRYCAFTLGRISSNETTTLHTGRFDSFHFSNCFR